jgi:NAD(P)-dependent dehydrogenase (short-subunit alcohol dehydrogenase family)
VGHYLVVGGAGGVGSALVERLAGRGDAVETTVLEEGEAAAIRSRYEGRVKAHVVDLSDAEAALGRLKAIADAMPVLDGAINCAAMAPWGATEVTPLATYLKAYEVNVVGGVAMYQAVMPALRRTRGHIVLIGSMGGRVALPVLSAYTCTKYALEGLGDIMRREAAPQGVKVSIVQPGGIRTNMVFQQFEGVRRSMEALQPEMRDRYGYLYESYARFAEAGLNEKSSSPDDVAAVVVAALDAEEPQSRYIVGEDAKEMLGMLGSMSDGDVDGMLAQLYTVGAGAEA